MGATEERRDDPLTSLLEGLDAEPRAVKAPEPPASSKDQERHENRYADLSAENKRLKERLAAVETDGSEDPVVKALVEIKAELAETKREAAETKREAAEAKRLAEEDRGREQSKQRNETLVASVLGDMGLEPQQQKAARFLLSSALGTRPTLSAAELTAIAKVSFKGKADPKEWVQTKAGDAALTERPQGAAPGSKATLPGPGQGDIAKMSAEQLFDHLRGKSSAALQALRSSSVQ